MIMRHRTGDVLFLLAALFIVLIIVAAIAAPLVSPFPPTQQNLQRRFHAPDAINLLGTDDFGRDLLSRLLYGARPALIVGLVAVSIALILGGMVGLLAGMGPRFLDQSLMLIMDSILSFQTILLAITVVSFMGYGLVQVMVALGIISSPVFARLVRAETLAIKNEGYIEASRALGTSPIKIIYRHVIPNIMRKVIVQSPLTFAQAVVVESSLSFLGVGIQPPAASWGLMLKDSRNYLIQAPWMAIFPGLVLALTVLSFNILGDSFSERFNPRLRNELRE
jgi:ABC-type dipeptide/oligopeptide/nickel transport system permease subunit